MKLHKLKDATAIGWFGVLVVLLRMHYYTTVLALLCVGAAVDAAIVFTDIGDHEVDVFQKA